MGDGVNIAARLQAVSKPGAICLSEDAYRQVKGRLELAVTDLGPSPLKNIAEPVPVYSLEVGRPALAKPTKSSAPAEAAHLSNVVLPFTRRCQGNAGFAHEAKRRLSSGDLRCKGAPLGQGSSVVRHGFETPGCACSGGQG